MLQDLWQDWPPALTPHEELIFVHSIPRDASAEEIFDIAMRERRRRLNRPSSQEEISRDYEFVRVDVAILAREHLPPAELAKATEQPFRSLQDAQSAVGLRE